MEKIFDYLKNEFTDVNETCYGISFRSKKDDTYYQLRDLWVGDYLEEIW